MMDNCGTNYTNDVRALFMSLADEFCNLRSFLQEQPFPAVDFIIEFKSQPGLPFRVIATLQGDELGLGVGEAFWAEWFPCNDQILSEFAAVLRGVLSGHIRLIEHQRKQQIVKAELQQQENGQWKTIARWSKLRFPSLVSVEKHILQNKAET